MSTATKSFDDALDFMPATTGGRGPFEKVRAFFNALGEGLEAQARYQHNVARGMRATDAARKAFDETFVDR